MIDGSALQNKENRKDIREMISDENQWKKMTIPYSNQTR